MYVASRYVGSRILFDTLIIEMGKRGKFHDAFPAGFLKFVMEGGTSESQGHDYESGSQRSRMIKKQ